MTTRFVSTRPSHMRLAKPFVPPWRWLPPLLVSSRYSVPSISMRPPAMRLAQRPTLLPAAAGSPKYPSGRR